MIAGSVQRWATPLIVLVIGTAYCQWCGAGTPAERFADAIKSYQYEATVRQTELADMAGIAQQSPAFTKADMALITAYMQAEAAAWTNAAAALQKGEEPTANNLVRQAHEMQARNDLWSQRLYARLRQSQENDHPAASEEAFDAMLADHQCVDLKEIAALLEARKRLAEAYGCLADATTPTADAQTLVTLKNQVWDLETEVDLAMMKLNWARDDRPGWTTTIIASANITPELKLAKQHLDDWRRQYEQTYRQKRACEIALEQKKQSYDELLGAYNRKFNEAEQAAKDHARPN